MATPTRQPVPPRRRATVHDLRRRNRATILDHLMHSGEGTRAQLAHACSLSTATLTNVVSGLIAEGLVTEAGHVPSDGGRPIARLTPRADGAYAIGADVGEHGITVDLFDLHLTLVDRVHTPGRPAEFAPHNIRAALHRSVETLGERNRSAVERVVGIGLGLPGVVELTASGGFTVSTQGLGWPVLPQHELAPELGIPTIAENGAKAMATAEIWRGAARGSRHCVAALVGRGVGAGIVEDGQLLRGVTGSAGEWGHSKVMLGGRSCHCGGAGCLESYIGGSSIIERWTELGESSVGDDERDLADILRRASDGDDAAERLIADTIEVLALGLANLVNLVNPEVIVLGGWVGSALSAMHLDDIRAAMTEHCLTRPGAAVRLEASELGSDSVALGAALLVFQLLVSGDLTVPATSARGR